MASHTIIVPEGLAPFFTCYLVIQGEIMTVNNNEMRPVRNVTAKDLLIAAIVLSYGIMVVAISILYSRMVGGIMIGLGGIVMMILYLKLPKEEKKSISKALLEQERTPIGKAAKIFQNLLYAIIGIAILLSLISKIK